MLLILRLSFHHLLQIREAKALNFRNSEPPAAFKTARINSMSTAAEASVQMASDLTAEATVFLSEAADAFDSLRDRSGDMEATQAELSATLEEHNAGIRDNYDRANEARGHADALTRQVSAKKRRGNTVAGRININNSSPLIMTYLRSGRNCRWRQGHIRPFALTSTLNV